MGRTVRQSGPMSTPGSTSPTAAPPAKSTRYWRRTLRLTGVLLLLWFGVTFGIAFFARELDFDFFGWPFSFWVGAQGALIVYCLIIATYARSMARLDAEYGTDEEEEERSG